MLRASLLLLLAVGTAACATLPVAAGGGAVGGAPAAVEAEVHRGVNEHRRVVGLAPLTYRAEIAVLAREHSQRIARGAVPFGHAGFEERERRLAEQLPVRAVGENVVAPAHTGGDVAGTAVRLWLQSAGHRASIEGCFSDTGVGVSQDRAGRFYLTQLFVRTASAESGCGGRPER